MPIIYLSPSTQDWNPYVTGSGSEEYWMNRIADAMEPYLHANTIRFRRQNASSKRSLAFREMRRTRILDCWDKKPVPRYRPFLLTTSTSPPLAASPSVFRISASYTQGCPLTMAFSALGVTV